MISFTHKLQPDNTVVRRGMGSIGDHYLNSLRTDIFIGEDLDRLLQLKVYDLHSFRRELKNRQRSFNAQEEDEEIEFDCANYQLEMMRCLRELNRELCHTVKPDDCCWSIGLEDQILEVGADILVTSSYQNVNKSVQATIPGFISKGLSTEEGEFLLENSAKLAIEARDSFWDSVKCILGHNYNRALVVASIGSYGAYLANGSELALLLVVLILAHELEVVEDAMQVYLKPSFIKVIELG
uniref:Hcy-binding domain-containing protein n=1 Tax=Cucumis melo TaxID=3656 RepID=A0A9I9E6H4_CUCME